MRKDKWKLNPEDIRSMITLYQEGLCKNDISRKFNVHHSTVIYHINKNGIPAPSRTIYTNIKRSPKEKKPEQEIFDLDGSRINRGKSYDEYCMANERRRLELQESCGHSKCMHTIKCKCCGKLIIESVTFVQ